MGRMILDNPEKYLCDLETFTKIFTIACSTVEITVKENTRVLRQYTSNKDNEYRVFVPTDQKYERAGIKLCKRPDLGKKLWKYAQLTEDKLFFPVDLIQYEKQFLVS